MIRINLLPIKEAQRALGRRQQLSVAVLSVLVALLVMVVPFVLQGRALKRLDGQTEQLRAEIRKLNDQAKEVRDLNEEKVELRTKLRIIDDLQQKRVGPTHILDDLSQATPEKLWLVDFHDTNAQATITGMALDNQTIADFMRQLQNSKYFYNVDLVETSQSEPLHVGGGDTNVVFKRFIIKAHLDYLGRNGKAPPAAKAHGTHGKKTGA